MLTGIRGSRMRRHVFEKYAIDWEEKIHFRTTDEKSERLALGWPVDFRFDFRIEWEFATDCI